MRTQLDDLKKELKDARYNLAYCKWKQLDEQSAMYRYWSDRVMEIISTINNIR